jgi:hypothetical protein
MERETLERRIAEEKEKGDKKLSAMHEEFYEKCKNDQGNYEEEIINLKEELREQETQYHNTV